MKLIIGQIEIKQYILFLFFLLSPSIVLSDEVLNLKCELTKFNDQLNAYKIGDIVYKKIPLKHKNIIVTKNNIKGFQLNLDNILFTEIDRLSGKLVEKSANLNLEFRNNLKNNIKNLSKEEMFIEIKKNTNRQVYLNQTSNKSHFDKLYWSDYEMNCQKVENKF